MVDAFAKKISLITTGFPWLIIFLVLLFAELYTRSDINRIDYLLMFIMSVWTFVSAFILKRKLNIDQKSRHHRSYFLLAIIPGWVVILIPFLFLGVDKLLVEAILLAFGISLVLLINNILYRISFHVSINTSIILILNHFTDWKYVLLFLTIPFIAWSRYYLKKHTPFQLLAGLLVPFIAYLLFWVTIGSIIK
jgi:membrane-associated phospholipid phosphatase